MKKDALACGLLWKLRNDVVRDLPLESLQQGHPIPLGVGDWATWDIRYYNLKITDDGAVNLSYLSEKENMTLVPMRLHPLKICKKFALELASVRMHGDAQTKSEVMAGTEQYKLGIEDDTACLTSGVTLPDELYLMLMIGTKLDDVGQGARSSTSTNDGKEQYQILGAESHEKRLKWIAQIEASGDRDL